MSKLKTKIKKLSSHNKGLLNQTRRLKKIIRELEFRKDQFIEVRKEHFARIYTDSKELAYIDKVMKRLGDDLYKRVAEEANYIHGIFGTEGPILHRADVREIIDD